MKPKQFLPNEVMEVVRRTSGRRFLLKPTRAMTEAILYCLAEAAQRTGVRLHSYNFLTNHEHLIASAPKANIPEFTQRFHRHVALCAKVLHHEEENVWDTRGSHEMILADEDRILKQMVYGIVNAVAAGLVPEVRQWPGAVSLPGDYVRPPKRIRRPKVFFKKDGGMPEFVWLELTLPPGYEGWTRARFASHLGLEVKRAEAEIHAQRKREGDERGFLGVKALLKLDPHDAPDTPRRRGIRPLVAASTKRLRDAILRRIREFREQYAVCLKAFRAGSRDTLFPAGTYRLRVDYALPCHPFVQRE